MLLVDEVVELEQLFSSLEAAISSGSFDIAQQQMVMLDNFIRQIPPSSLDNNKALTDALSLAQKRINDSIPLLEKEKLAILNKGNINLFDDGVVYRKNHGRY